MLQTRPYLVALTLAASAAVWAVACGGTAAQSTSAGAGGHSSSSSSSHSSSSSSSSSSASSASSTSTSGQPCPTTDTVLAVSTLRFGEGNNGEWKAFGFNLDGVTSTAASTGLCQLNSGAAPDTPYPDGNNGIDNSFGKNLLPIIISFDPTWPTDVATAINQGQFTALLELDCLYPTGDDNDPAFNTKVFAGTQLPQPPKWDGTDKWPVDPDLLNSPTDPESSSIVFDGCSVKGTTFSTGTNGTLVLTIPVTIQGNTTTLKLTLYAAKVTMTLAADRMSATAGMIGGVLKTQEVLAQVDNLGKVLGLCGTPELTQLETLVKQASDIMADGTQDPTQVCDGISVGFGFDMKPAQIGIVGPTPPPAMTCP